MEPLLSKIAAGKLCATLARKLARGKLLFSLLFLLGVMSSIATKSQAADLVLAEKGASNYQIVLPDQAADATVDRWLMVTAKLMQTAFKRNGFDVAVVKESAKAPNKPGIYLGATEFAKKNKIEVNTNDWTYKWKTVGPDLVIIGTDREDSGSGKAFNKGAEIKLALVGTVKGALDFLHDYVGTRFLFINFAPPLTALKGDDLTVDTRSIEFLPTPRIAIPADLNRVKTPPLRARAASNRNTEDFYTIAMNYFPAMESTASAPSHLYWSEVIPLDKYEKSHPEYFALLPSGKRASVTTLDYQPGTNQNSEVALDPTNPDVLNLMYLELEKRIQEGAKSIEIHPLDSFLLSRCNCDRCNAFFGMGAMTEEEVRARVVTGKIWQIYFRITERLREKYPDAQIIIWDYQEHRLNPQVIQEIPANVTPKFQFGALQDFDRLDGIDIPGGIVGLEETFTGFGIGGPYAPERTPGYAAKIAQAMVAHKIRWTSRDGVIGYSRGLSAPAYYVYGRMLDDPSANYQDILKEFYTSAFANVSPQMTEFYELLYKQMTPYSDLYGVQAPQLKFARNRDNYNKWVHENIYTPEFNAKANALLTDAEQKATDPDVKARLSLIRIEFNYVSELGNIFVLQDAWTRNPSAANLEALLDAVDQWHGEIKALAGGIGSSQFKPLPNWPQMRPFGGNFYVHAALEYRTYQGYGWKETAIGWDTAAIRNGALNPPKPLQVPAVTSSPDINSEAWEKAPTEVLRLGSGMPMTVTLTALKVLHDQDNLYVRIESRVDPMVMGNPTKYIDKMLAPKSEKDVPKQEYVELTIQPKAGGKVYRLAATPTKGVRYDAIMTPAEDTSWNGQWQYAYEISKKRTPSDPYPHWTAWFKIPFADFGAAPPAPGETWKFNAARFQDGRYYQTWQGGRSSITKPESMGEIKFR